MKRAITLAALAAASTAASADWNNTNIDIELNRSDMPGLTFAQQSMTAAPGATGIINFAGMDLFSVTIEGDRVEITALADPAVLDSSGAGTALHMINFVATNPTDTIRSADISISNTPTNWADATAFKFTDNGVYIPLNSTGDLALLDKGTTISVDLGFNAVPTPGAMSVLGLAGCAALRRRR